MIEYIKETCEELNVPILNMHFEDDKIYEKEANKVWTKEKIYTCIEDNEAGLNFHLISL